MEMVTCYSNKLAAIQKRIERLPEFVIGIMRTYSKKDAEGLVKTFQEGIRENKFGLIPLSPNTVARKKGMPSPDTPLFGAGDTKKNSLINALQIKKLRNGYQVKGRRARHHTSKLSLEALLDVHEFGCIINNAFGIPGRLVRIPPRPAFRYAYRDYMKYRSRQDYSRKVKMAIVRWINKAQSDELEKLIDRGTEEYRE